MPVPPNTNRLFPCSTTGEEDTHIPLMQLLPTVSAHEPRPSEKLKHVYFNDLKDSSEHGLVHTVLKDYLTCSLVDV